MTTQSKRIVQIAASTVLIVLALAVSWYLGSRAGHKATNHASEMSDAASRGGVYPDIRGRVVRIMPEEGIIGIDHQEIIGLMGAMTMDMPLADRRELRGLELNEEIYFDLVKLNGKYQVVRIRPVSQQPGLADNQATAQPSLPPLNRGDLVPDLALIDSQGKAFSLRQLPARSKIITFFYARCPMEEFCPAQSHRLAQLQKQIDVADNSAHLISLSLDAANDTSQVLADYAKAFDANPAHWTLATSHDPQQIRDFANRAGGRISVNDNSPLIDHALVAVRVDGDRIVDFAYGLDAITQMILNARSQTMP